MPFTTLAALQKNCTLRSNGADSRTINSDEHHTVKHECYIYFHYYAIPYSTAIKLQYIIFTRVITIHVKGQ